MKLSCPSGLLRCATILERAAVANRQNERNPQLAASFWQPRLARALRWFALELGLGAWRGQLASHSCPAARKEHPLSGACVSIVLGASWPVASVISSEPI